VSAKFIKLTGALEGDASGGYVSIDHIVAFASDEEKTLMVLQGATRPMGVLETSEQILKLIEDAQ